MKIQRFILPFFLLILCGCRHEMQINNQEEHQLDDKLNSKVLGMYLLNEGNMGSNKATLDYLDFSTGTYLSDIYSSRNPSVVKELGDVGNDLQIYGNRLYAVINASNKIEVMTADSAIRIGQINVPNCRCLAFEGQYGYVTSYAGPIELGEEHAQRGYVLKFDTATLQAVDTCHVGFQPEGLTVANGKLYVANSGGYLINRYDSTLSVIDIETFKQVQLIAIDINMQHVNKDKYGHLWINSLGDYYDNKSKLYCFDPLTSSLLATLPYPVSNFHISGDSLYFYSAEWNYSQMESTMSYGVIDIRNYSLITEHFITDGTESEIEVPYGIIVHPVSHDIYVADAKTYIIPGVLNCYSPDGIRKWSVRTGDIPAHFCFLIK